MTRAADRDQDRLPDPQAVLRTRLAAYLQSSPADAMAGLVGSTGLPPDTLAAFARGAHLAGWAAERLTRLLDESGRP